MNKCAIDNCGKRVKGYGFCEKHYQKFKAHGDPLGGYEKASAPSDGLCTVEGCGGKFVAKGFCGKHYQALKNHGNPFGSRPKRADFLGCVRKDGYVINQRDNVKTLGHVEVAERALGKPLPSSAVVHHVDENPSNNAQANLVICPDQAYHMLLHARMRAMAACGNPNWRKCVYCKEWDDPAKFGGGDRKAFHRACDAERARAYRASLNQKKATE